MIYMIPHFIISEEAHTIVIIR